MNKYYQRGKRAELEAKKLLEKDGYYVTNSAGSKGKADLVAVDLGGKYNLPSPLYAARLIQIKSCYEKDLKKYKQEKERGIELWIKILNKDWVRIID